MLSNAVCAYSLGEARYDRNGPRTIMATITASQDTRGYIFNQGGPGAHLSVYMVNGDLWIRNNAGWPARLRLSSIPDEHTYHVAWICEQNPDTTGSSDAYISWVVAWDVDAGVALRSEPVTHPAKQADPTQACWGSDDSAGLSAFSGTITRVGFHHRALTLAEIHDDYVAAAAPFETQVTVERPTVPMTLDMGLGARDQLHGPVYAWAARQHHQLRRRTSTGRTIRCAPVDIGVGWYIDNPRVRLAPQSTGYRMVLGWCWPVPVQPVHSHLWVRVHAATWGGIMNPIAPVGLRVYSSNKPAQLAVPDGEPYEQSWRGDTWDRNDLVPINGEWSVDVLVPIKRGMSGMREGWTYVSLAYALFPSVGLSDPTLRVNAVQIVPCPVPADAGGPIGGFQE